MSSLPYGPEYYGQMLAVFEGEGWGHREIGVWYALRARQWVAGSLPADITKLVRMTGAPRAIVTTVIEKCFPLNQDGTARCDPTLEDGRTSAATRHETAVKMGRAGAEKRWHKQRAADSSAIPAANSRAIGSTNARANSNQSPKDFGSKTRIPKAAVALRARPDQAPADPVPPMTTQERRDYLRDGALVLAQTEPGR